jgi:hypothetical protein
VWPHYRASLSLVRFIVPHQRKRKLSPSAAPPGLTAVKAPIAKDKFADALRYSARQIDKIRSIARGRFKIEQMHTPPRKIMTGH